MAGPIDTGAAGHGKRPLDAELNLVPFIDLLCSLISFLLMTAVWTQISRLELKQGAENPDQEIESPPPPEQPDTVELKLFIHDKGFTLVEVGKDVDVAVPCKDVPCIKLTSTQDAKGQVTSDLLSNYDYENLVLKLKDEKTKYAAQKNISLVLNDNVPYNELIRTMDICLAVGLDGISLSGSLM